MPSTNISGAIISNIITLTPDANGLVTLPIDETGDGLFVRIDGGNVLSLHVTGDNLLTTALGCTLSLAI